MKDEDTGQPNPMNRQMTGRVLPGFGRGHLGGHRLLPLSRLRRSSLRWVTAAFFASVLNTFPATAPSQSATQDWQAQAVRKYPDLGVGGSLFNQQFVTAVGERRRTNPAFFSNPRWPLLLADELAQKSALVTPPPRVDSAPAPAPAMVAAATPLPAPATADYDAGTLPKATGLASARFRWWSPPAVPVRGVLVLLAGRGGDSRGMVGEKDWQALANQTRFGLVGAQLVNPPDNPYQFQEDQGGAISDLLNKAVTALLTQSGQKLKEPPLAFWGHSAGGNITQQYMSRHANRVAGAVLMRATGGPGSLAPGKDDVPTLICVGGKDKPEWVKDALANYEKGHKVRADWTLALNPNEGHEVGGTQGLALAYLLAAINARLPPAPTAGVFASDSASPATILRLNKQAGWLGDPTTNEVAEYDKFTGKKQDAVWLPDEPSAKAWQAYLRGL